MTSASDKRPVYLNLLKVALPVGAVASILHRVSGVLLVAVIPVAIYLFQRSLTGPEGFDEVVRVLRSPWMKAAGTVVLWAVAHHLLVGVRFLLMDVRLIRGLPATRTSAWVANVAAPLLAVLLLWRWW